MAKTLDPMDLKQIIRLHLDGLSNRKIGETLSIDRNAVNSCMQQFTACDKTMKQLLELEDNALKELFSSKTTIWLFRSNCASVFGVIVPHKKEKNETVLQS